MTDNIVSDQAVNWAEIARAYEKVVLRNSVFEGLNNDLLNQLDINLVKSNQNNHVIDLGCGLGYLIEKMNVRYDNLKVTGVDFSTEMLAIAKDEIISKDQMDRVTLIQGDVTCLDFEEEKFDAAVSCNLIFNLDDPLSFLKMVCRMLKKDSCLVLTGPKKGCDFNRLMSGIKKSLNEQGVLAEKQKYVDIVENVERRFQGERSALEKKFNLYTNEEVEALFLEAGFTEIMYSGVSYGIENFLVVGKK